MNFNQKGLDVLPKTSRPFDENDGRFWTKRQEVLGKRSCRFYEICKRPVHRTFRSCFSSGDSIIESFLKAQFLLSIFEANVLMIFRARISSSMAIAFIIR
ncbi:hypothetical protein [Epilithonimonas caeni]|uniref:hypothetical protein n=1 Tax=Epilithonimonas caeni TaxID=365343 RepID=UPI0012EBD1F7|nr:hypothetical protein [Epilithonimonas caeni]